VKVTIQAGNIAVDESLRAHLERRLAFALSSFGDRVRGILVRLSHQEPLSDPLGRCEIEIMLHPRTVRVADTGADLFAAVENAAHRAGRSVARALERERAWTAGDGAAGPEGPEGKRGRK
jgi:putative sigma-54 modulation protein